MYRSFLSWRYLRHRPTNLIGMVGIFVAVGALILILSIMTGFLEETRRAVRGSLADLLIEPSSPNAALLQEPGPILEALAATPEVRAATAQLRYAGIVSLTGSGARYSEQLLRSAGYGDLSLTELVGVDVRTPERGLQVALAGIELVTGVPLARSVIHDELDTTGFYESLLRVPREAAEREAKIEAEGPASVSGRPDDTGLPVGNPFFPFDGKPRPEFGAGNDPVAPRPLPGVVVGATLAYQLSLSRGEVIQIATALPGASDDELTVNNLQFVVTGTFKSSENEMNLGRVYMDRAQLRRLMGGTAAFSQVLVSLEDYEADGTRVRDELVESLGAKGLLSGRASIQEVRTWEQFRGNLLGAIENERLLMGIMLSLVMVVAGFTVFAILSMMVTEKRRDIGILCALGATRTGVLQTFLWIAFWDAIVGALLGAVFGVWAALRIDDIEQWLSRTLGVQIFNRDVYLFDHIPTVVIPYAVGLIVLGAFVCALLFAALPAWRAARLDPLEALRYE